MNARLLKPTYMLLLSLCLALTSSMAHAQSASTGEVPPPPGYGSSVNSPFDIQIENGILLITPLKSRVDVKAIWGPGDIHGVPATIGNLAKYLRAANTNLNIVVSPGGEDVKINDLILRSGDMKALTEAVTIATDSKIRGSPLSGKDNWTFYAQPQPTAERTVEVFNLSSYIQSLGEPDRDAVAKSLDEIQQLILSTLHEVVYRGNYSSADDPIFRYHPGTKLLIVSGPPKAMEITGKIINALAGQHISTRDDQLDKPASAPQK